MESGKRKKKKNKRLRLSSLAACIKERSPERQGPPHRPRGRGKVGISRSAAAIMLPLRLVLPFLNVGNWEPAQERLRLRAHTLKVETAAWDTRNALLCDCYYCDEIQDEAHALLVCRDADVCALRRKHAYLFNCFSGDFSMEQPYLQQLSVQATRPLVGLTVSRSADCWVLPQCTLASVQRISFSSLVDTGQQAEQPTLLKAKSHGHPVILRQPSHFMCICQQLSGMSSQGVAYVMHLMTFKIISIEVSSMEGQEFSSELQVCHMSFLKGTLGVKRATKNWTVLRECGHVPLQFYWFKSAIKMYNGLLNSNCEKLRKTLPADAGNYRMLAISGTFYRLQANVMCTLFQDWCPKNNKVPDCQFGFFPGRSTFHPLFNSRHLKHVAQTCKPHGLSHPYLAFLISNRPTTPSLATSYGTIYTNASSLFTFSIS
eukprot:1153738-Pelagomonas_calceolata.AAC.1